MTEVRGRHYYDGKVHAWRGGDCPIPDAKRAKLWFSDGTASVTYDPAGYNWARPELNPNAYTIVGFQVFE